MGYNTNFEGELKFTSELTVKQLAYLSSILDIGSINGIYIDLELLDDFSGLCHDDSEKSYGIIDGVNMLIKRMVDRYPDFGLQGKLIAQGEDPDDKWELVIENGMAKEIKIKLIDARKNIVCPYCGDEFRIEKGKLS